MRDVGIKDEGRECRRDLGILNMNMPRHGGTHELRWETRLNLCLYECMPSECRCLWRAGEGAGSPGDAVVNHLMWGL